MKIGRHIEMLNGRHWQNIASLDCLGSPSNQRFFKPVDAALGDTAMGPTLRQMWAVEQATQKAVLRKMYIMETLWH